MSPRRLVLALVAAGLAVAAVPASAATSGTRSTAVPCTGNPSSVGTLTYRVAGQQARARYALPAGRPKGIVVFDHGYGHTMYSWSRHLARTARTLGVIAVAPDYRGQQDLPPTTRGALPTSRGWQVAEGAADSIAAGQLFDRRCGHRGTNVVYGVSMGGNTSGLVLASRPKDARGRPLFDYWVDVEGAVNVTETYQAARRLAPANAYAAKATADIEREMGGTFEDRADVYLRRTVVHRTADIAASGVRGVAIAHGIDDGLVTHDESRQLQMLLRAQGVPVDMWSALTRSAHSEPGTTIDGYLPVPHTSPFDGHASETSETQDVGLAGFAALARILHGAPPNCTAAVYDGTADRTVASVTDPTC